MAKAEGKTFSFEGPKTIRTDFLETFAYKGNKQLVEYSTDEFSAVCPFSGLPDYGTITVKYIPRAKRLETEILTGKHLSFLNGNCRLAANI